MDKKDSEDFEQDPRNAFINFLIKNMFLIEERIFFASRYLSAIEPLQGLIGSLDSNSKKKLVKQRKELEAFEANTNLCSATKIKQIYYDVLDRLQDTYLIEFRRHRLEKEDLDKLEKEGP